MRASDLHRLARQVREIALVATGNTGDDTVTGGELAVLEDLARHPDSTVSEITRRVGLAQSLVSRICRRMLTAGVVQAIPDPADARKRHIALNPDVLTRSHDLGATSIDAAIAAVTPHLDSADREELISHLDAAARLLRSATHQSALET